MISRATAPRQPRLVILATVFGAHMLLLALFLQQRNVAPRVAPPGAIGIITVATPPVARNAPPPMPLPTKIPAVTVPLNVPVSNASLAPTDATEGTAGTCALLGEMSQALLADSIVLDAIRRAPPETRSLADAVVVWNAGWVQAAGIDAPLGPVRVLVEQALLASEDRCLDEPLAGPRLLAIPNGDRTMFLVFGSGAWTWRQVLVSASAVSQDRQSPTVPSAGSRPVTTLSHSSSARTQDGTKPPT